MANIPSRAASRIAAGIKRFQPILASQKSRDVNESDTVVIVTDMLQEVFGYDKFAEITSEHTIKGTFCDLAIKLDGTLAFLVEVKAIGMEAKDSYVKQAVDYAANQGTDWVVLTTGIIWRIYKVCFTKPIEHEMVLELNFLELDPKEEEDLELVWMLTKEAWQKKSLTEYHTQRLALNRFTLAGLLLTEALLSTLRRELKKVSPGVRIEIAEIESVLRLEVIKREVIEGEKSEEACKQITKAAKKAMKSKAGETDDEPPPENPSPEVAP